MTAAPAILADEAGVKTIIESYATLTDRCEFEALEKLYADELKLDYSSLSGDPAAVIKPEILMTSWARLLPGFDRTRHNLSDLSASVDGDEAVATANVRAGYWLGQDYWETQGRYRFELTRQAEGWKITAMTFTLENEIGSRDMFTGAALAAAAAPPSYLQRRETRQTVLDFLTGLEEKDVQKINDCWAENAMQGAPYTPEDWPALVSIKGFVDHLAFYPMIDPQAIYVEFKNPAASSADSPARQPYGGVFHVENGKITRYREYFDPREFDRA